MKFIVDRDIVAGALSFLADHTTTMGTNPTMNSIFINAEEDGLVCRAISGVVSAQVKIPAVVQETGELIVDGRTLSASATTLGSGDIRISGKKRLNIKQGKSVRRLLTSAAASFPDIPKVKAGVDIAVDIETLMKALKHVDFARSKTEVRPILKGYYIDLGNSGMIITADGKRAAFSSIGIKAPESIVVAPEGIMALQKALSLDVLKSDPPDTVAVRGSPSGWTQFDLGVVDIRVAAIGGMYPSSAMEMAVQLRENPGDTTVELEKSKLNNVLAMAGVLEELASVSQSLKAVAMEVEGKSVTFRMDTSDGYMDDVVGADISGEELSISVLPSSLSQALDSSPTDTITMKFWGPDKPFLIQSSEGWMVIQSPVVDDAAARRWLERRSKQTTQEPVEEQVEYDEDEGDF